MNEKQKYEYVTLRYMHDAVTEEFVNVGVVMRAIPEGRVCARFVGTSSRVTKLFPAVNGHHFRQLLKNIRRGFEGIDKKSNSLRFSNNENIYDVVKYVLPIDDSALRWSSISYGITYSIDSTFDQLYTRLVSRYEDSHHKSHRDEDEIWKNFKKNFPEKEVLNKLSAKTISVQDDEIEFEHAWKNGIWHCIEPLSFDLSSPQGITEKAHKWLGQISSVANTSDKFKVYFLLASPAEADLIDAYKKAVSILKKAPEKVELIEESEFQAFGERIAMAIAEHDAGNQALH